MSDRVKSAALAAALVTMVPLAAGAVTVSGNLAVNYDANAGNNVPSFEVGDGLGFYVFNAVFTGGESGGNYEFLFENFSDTDHTVSLTYATVNQFPNFAYFAGDSTLSFGSLASVTIAQGTNYSGILTTTIAARGTAKLSFDYGAVVGSPDLSLRVAAVPVPAAGLLLLTALGGLAVARRRKTA